TYSTQPSSNNDSNVALHTNIAASPVVADKSVYVLSDDGALSAFRSDAVDSLGPDITVSEPDMGVVINGSPPLRFEGKITDEGSGVDPSSIKLMIDSVGIPKKP